MLLLVPSGLVPYHVPLPLCHVYWEEEDTLFVYMLVIFLNTLNFSPASVSGCVDKINICVQMNHNQAQEKVSIQYDEETVFSHRQGKSITFVKKVEWHLCSFCLM